MFSILNLNLTDYCKVIVQIIVETAHRLDKLTNITLNYQPKYTIRTSRPTDY